MKSRAAAIVVHRNHLLLIHREKAGAQYFTLPGGGIEMGETPEAACLRELAEETGLRGTIHSKCCVTQSNGRLEYFFCITEFRGIPRLGGPEKHRNSEGNKYTLLWVPLDDLRSFDIRPEGIKERIQDFVASL